MIQIMKLRTTASLFFLSLLLAFPGVSLGHAFPDHSDPRVGSTIAGSPASVRIWFDGDLEPIFSTITVKDAGGKKVDKGNGRVNPSNAALLEVGLPTLAAGTYHVFWNVVARDGHRTIGDYTFAIK
jgi:methionine-rich copper-binding protein CopC